MSDNAGYIPLSQDGNHDLQNLWAQEGRCSFVDTGFQKRTFKPPL